MSRDTSDQRIGEPTRRALLGSGLAGAASMLAGCSGGGGGDGDGTATSTPTGGSGPTDTQGPTATQTPTELADVSGQTLTWFTMSPIENMTWMGTTPVGGPTGPYFRPNTKMPYRMTMQPAIRIGQTGEPVLEGYESVDKTEDEITVTVRDDWNWSNGDPVTAADALAIPLAFMVASKVDTGGGDQGYALQGLHTRVADYEMPDEKTFKLVSNDLGFGDLGMEPVYRSITMTNGGPWAGIRQNVAMAPYDDWWAAIKEDWERAKGGDWHPDDWQIQTRYLEPMLGGKGYSSNQEESSYEQYWEKYYREPDNVVVHGAWTLDAINGTKNVELTPNPEYYDADKVNFDKIKIVRRQSDRANRAAINANSQDYYRGNVPSHIAQSVPDDIEQRMVAANGGLGFAVNHRGDLLGKRQVRQAIVHAIDASRLARSVHQEKYSVIETPGGHAWGGESELGQDWIENNLQNFGERDLETAASLMQSAGYTREGGKWTDSDGNPVTMEIPSAKATPTLAPTLAGQLSSFGIDATLQTYSGTIFGEKKNAGEFNIWSTNRGLGFNQRAIGRLYLYFMVLEPWARKLFRVFPKEQVDAVNYADIGIISSKEGQSQLENVSPCTIEAPPIGEPDGELQTYHPPKLSLIAMGSNDPDIAQEAYRKLAWVYNYDMPIIPIANARTQHFLDSGHWHWPGADSNTWQVAGNIPEHLLSYGRFLQANPNNTEEGASVEE